MYTTAFRSANSLAIKKEQARVIRHERFASLCFAVVSLWSKCYPCHWNSFLWRFIRLSSDYPGEEVMFVISPPSGCVWCIRWTAFIIVRRKWKNNFRTKKDNTFLCPLPERFVAIAIDQWILNYYLQDRSKFTKCFIYDLPFGKP